MSGVGNVVNIDTLGVPVPLAWQVQQVRGADGKMYAKLVLATPIGVLAFLMQGDEAQHLASQLRKAGQHAAAGIWSPVAPGQASTPRRTSAPAEPVSGAEGA
jgi:hypothetical protein